MTPRPDLSTLPFRPAAVLELTASEDGTITELVTPLLRAALAVRYGAGGYKESVFYLHLAAVLERQELMPFAMDGIALAYPDHDSKIPVERKGIRAPIVAVGVCEAGAHWRLPVNSGRRGAGSSDAIDGKPVHVVFLILSGEGPKEDLILKAGIARWARVHAS